MCLGCLSTNIQTEPDFITQIACFLPRTCVDDELEKVYACLCAHVCVYMRACVSRKSQMQRTKGDQLHLLKNFQIISGLGPWGPGFEMSPKIPPFPQNVEDCQKDTNFLFCQGRIFFKRTWNVIITFFSWKKGWFTHTVTHTGTQKKVSRDLRVNKIKQM